MRHGAERSPSRQESVATPTSVTITATMNNNKWFDAQKVTVFIVPTNAVTLASLTLQSASWSPFQAMAQICCQTVNGLAG